MPERVLSVVVARVRRPHGMKGELLCDDITEGLLEVTPGTEAVLALKTGEVTVTVEGFRRTAKGVIYKLARIDDLTAAEAVKGAEVRVAADKLPALPADEYYAYELAGLPVYDARGNLVGEVTGYLTTAGNDVLVIDRRGEEYLVPFVRAHVVSVVPGDRIVINYVSWE